MRILVCMKLISALRFADMLSLGRVSDRLSRGDLVANPADLCALEAALCLKDHNKGCTITVMTMAPAAGESVLRNCIAMGADNAIHLCDSRFAGADTGVTSRVLCAGILKLPRQDLILCGQKSLDSSTGHIGAQLAYLLDLPYLPDVVHITRRDHSFCFMHAGNGFMASYEAQPPLLVSVRAGPELVRNPTIQGLRSSKHAEILRFTGEDLALPPEISSHTRTLETLDYGFASRRSVFYTDGAEAVSALEALLRKENVHA